MDLLNTKIYSICFLDSLSLGLLAPDLSTHIFRLGGSHTTLGILSSLYVICQFISGPIARTMKQNRGAKLTLSAILFLNCLVGLFLAFNKFLLISIFLRLIAAATNQIQTLCKAFAFQYNAKKRQQSVLNVMNGVSVAGYIVGPILGGITFEFTNEFGFNALISALALFLSFFLSLTLPSNSENTKDNTGFIHKLKQECKSFQVVNNLDLSQQWDPVLLKILYHTSTCLFFIKFSMLLKMNYKASSAIVGCTYAYQNILAFLSELSFPYLKNTFSNFNSNSLIFTLFSATASFFGLCFAPSYDYYLLSFIPMIFAHILMAHSWKEMFTLRSTSKNDIRHLDDVLAKLVAVFAPIFLGISCDMYGLPAFQTFILSPLILALGISIFFNIGRPMVEQSEKKAQ